MLLALITTCLRWLMSPHLGDVTPGNNTCGTGFDLNTSALANAFKAHERKPRLGLGLFALLHAPLSLSPPRLTRV